MLGAVGDQLHPDQIARYDDRDRGRRDPSAAGTGRPGAREALARSIRSRARPPTQSVNFRRSSDVRDENSTCPRSLTPQTCTPEVSRSHCRAVCRSRSRGVLWGGRDAALQAPRATVIRKHPSTAAPRDSIDMRLATWLDRPGITPNRAVESAARNRIGATSRPQVQQARVGRRRPARWAGSPRRLVSLDRRRRPVELARER